MAKMRWIQRSNNKEKYPGNFIIVEFGALNLLFYDGGDLFSFFFHIYDRQYQGHFVLFLFISSHVNIKIHST